MLYSYDKVVEHFGSKYLLKKAVEAGGRFFGRAYLYPENVHPFTA